MLDHFDEDDLIPAEFAEALALVAGEILDIGDGDAIVRRYAAYVDDPIAFFVHELGVTPWESEDPEQAGQADVIRAVARSNRVAVKSGHKTSKSCTAAGLALWRVATRVGARVVISAPAFHQIKNIIWKEIRERFRTRPLSTGLMAEPALDPGTGLQLPNGNQVIGISTRTAENLAGLSAPDLFIIVDEASGFADHLWETILGNAAGGAKLFAISNPTRTTGWFYNLFRVRAEGWILLTLNSENTPNARSGEKLIPGLCTLDFVLEMRALHGPNYLESPFYMVRILGQFPGQGVDAVVSATLLERATRRWKERTPAATEGELVIGVDVARFGNDANTLQPVRGRYAYRPSVVDVSAAKDDPGVTAGDLVADAVIATAFRLRQGEERVRVNVDGIGVGAAVVDALKRRDEVKRGWIYIVDMNVGESADEQETLLGDTRVNFANLRSQLWFGVGAWTKTGELPDVDALHTELLAATYTTDERGRLRVEEKKKMRAVLGRSPDHADALCLAVYRGSRGSWTSFAYDAAPDHRHGSAPTRVRSNFYLPPRDDDDSGSGTGGGSYSFF